MKKRFTILGAFLLVVGVVFVAAGAVAYTKVQDGYDSLQAFSEAQNVTLSYHDHGELIDRGTTEGADAIMTLLREDWQYPVVGSDLDPNDPLVNTGTEYMFMMATIGHHVLDGTQTVVFECPECFSQFGLLMNPMETKPRNSLRGATSFSPVPPPSPNV